MKTKFKKGFTLIEILIASAIFAVIMVMATAVFSLTSSYNTKIQETRRVLSDARSAANQISDDIRLSNGEATVKFTGQADTKVKDVFFVEVDQDGILQSIYVNNGTNTTAGFGYTLPTDTSDKPENHLALGIVQRNQGQIILYWPQFVDPNYNLYRSVIKVSTPTEWDSAISLGRSNRDSTAQINSNTSLDARFRGYTVPASRNQQPFIYFGILGKTSKYDSASPRTRSQIEIKSLVESRDYN